MSIISNSTIKLNVTSEIQDVLSSFTLSESKRENSIVIFVPEETEDAGCKWSA